MKLRILLLILFLPVVAQTALAQQVNGPLGKDQVMDLVKAGMETPELVKLIQVKGIDFDLSDDYLQTLRLAGAQDAVIQALRAARPKPLTRQQVLELVVGHVPNERAAALVKQHGIDFLADERYLQTLRLAGADDTLIAALRAASEAVTGSLVVETSPNAEVDLDGTLQGHADAQGKLAIKAKLGPHALKVTLAGKKNFEQSVTLDGGGGPATLIEARLIDVAPSQPGAVRKNPRDGLKYVWIPPGTFMMGCSPGDGECYDNEKPAHLVTATKGFWMGQTAVTAGAYKRFATAAGREMASAPTFNTGWANENMPVVNVSWDDARAYCGWIGGRLPTEAEWEYAARAGSTEPRYGNLDEIAWYNQNSGRQTRDVAQKRANGFGLYDMLGNVWEWVNDWYDQNYYQNSPQQDPTGPATGQLRVLRGGSWNALGPRSVRVTFRSKLDPAGGYISIGFRCGGEVFVP